MLHTLLLKPSPPKWGNVTKLLGTQKLKQQIRQNEVTENLQPPNTKNVPKKEQDKAPEVELSEGIGNLSQKIFKVLIIKMIKGMGRRMNEKRSLIIKDKEEPKRGEECNN